MRVATTFAKAASVATWSVISTPSGSSPRERTVTAAVAPREVTAESSTWPLGAAAARVEKETDRVAERPLGPTAVTTAVKAVPAARPVKANVSSPAAESVREIVRPSTATESATVSLPAPSCERRTRIVAPKAVTPSAAADESAGAV